MATDVLLYGHFVASKVGKTGLADVTVDIDKIEKATGTRTAVVTAGAATEGRRGYYYYRLASATPLTHDYVAIFMTADATVDQRQVAAVRPDLAEGWAAIFAYLDAAISTRLPTASYTAAPSAGTVADTILDDEEVSAGVTVRQALAAAGGAADPLTNAVPGSYAQGTAGYILGSINPAQVTIVSPVSSDGTAITVVRGDDYLLTDNRALTFTGATWPSITGASIALKVNFSGAIMSYTGTVTAADSCYVELTDTQTAAMATGTFDYDLEATLSNGSIVTLVQGQALILPDIR